MGTNTLFLLKLLILSSISYTEHFSSNTFSSRQCQTQGNGTTSNIEQIFMGRCYYFIKIQQSTNCDINPANYNCSQIFISFKTALVGKDPCSVTIGDFDDFLKLVYHPIAANTSVFWSGAYYIFLYLYFYFNY